MSLWQGAEGVHDMTGQEAGGTAPRTMWAYGYEIASSMSQDRLRHIEDLLHLEHSKARYDQRTWEGRFVLEERVTHILVVSDSPDQQLEVNRKLEEELARLDAVFSITPPVAVRGPAQEL